MTNNFGVNILTRTAPPSTGTLQETATLFLVGKFGTGPTTKPALCQSIVDFENAVGARGGEITTGWDYLDIFFREGGNNAYVLDYSGSLATALGLLDPRLGPGQVVAPYEKPTKANVEAIKTHVDAANRIALIDVEETDDTAAEFEAKGKVVQEVTNFERAGVFAPWTNEPAPAGVVGGSARKVHASASVAGLIARVDQLGNPNVPAGGYDFPLNYATGILYDPTDAERNTIFAKGVNTWKSQFSQIENYGFVTPITPDSATPFWQLNCSRTRMYLARALDQIGQKYYMKEVDGQGHLAAQLASDIKEVLKALWEKGGLYGDKPDEAYSVNVGVTVNTEAEVAQGHLNAVVQARLSLYAAQVNITLVSVPVAGVVA